MTHFLRLLALIFSLFLGTACLPVKAPSQHLYNLTAVNENCIYAKPTQAILLVAMPTATPSYATNKIAYKVKPYRVDYFAENFWVGQPAYLLSPLMVDSLTRTHHFKSVVAAPYPGSADYYLETKLLRLEQNFLVEPSEENVVVQFILINNRTQRLMASKTIAVTVPATADTPYGGVIAANAAVAQILCELAAFVVRSV